MAVPFSSKVRAPEDVLASQLDGEAVLLKLQSECYFGIDEVGTRMWELLLASDSVQAAYDELLKEFDVAPDELRDALAEFVDKLLQQGLVEVAPR